MKTVLFLLMALIALPLIGLSAQVSMDTLLQLMEAKKIDYSPSMGTVVYTGTGLIPSISEKKFVLVFSAGNKFELFKDGELVSNNSVCFLGYCILLYFPDSLSYFTPYQFGLYSNGDTVSFSAFFASQPNPPTSSGSQFSWQVAPDIDGLKPIYDFIVYNDSLVIGYTGSKTTITSHDFNHFYQGDTTLLAGTYKMALRILYQQSGVPELRIQSPYSEATSIMVASKVSPRIISPVDIDLKPNYPNPFNPTTTIEYSLPKASEVSLTVYNMIGQIQEALYSGRQDAGQHQIAWDASQVPAGIYFLRMEADGVSRTVKMTVLK